MATPKTPLVLDISHHNTVVSFQDIYKAGIRGIIHKASQGATNVDNTYASRRKDALWAGMLWGGYHWIDSSNVKTQVSNFLRAADPAENTLLACDAERNDRANWNATLDQIKEFLTLIYEKTGQRPKLYGGEYLKSILDGRPDPFLSQHHLWLSQYGPRAVCPPGWDKPLFWQYAEHGRVAGMAADGNVDLDSYEGSNLTADWVHRVVVPLKAPDIVDKIAKVNGKIKGEAFSIPAADPPKDDPLTFSAGPLVDPPQQKVTLGQLMPVSRKAFRLVWLKRLGHLTWMSITGDKILSWMGIAQNTRQQVESFVSDHQTAVLLTGIILALGVIESIGALMADDVNEGRAVASGSVTPTDK